MYWLWSIANNQISVQIENCVPSVLKQYLNIYSLSCAKTLPVHVKTFAASNDISYIRIHCGKPYIYGIKVGCIFGGHPVHVVLFHQVYSFPFNLTAFQLD